MADPYFRCTTCSGRWFQNLQLMLLEARGVVSAGSVQAAIMCAKCQTIYTLTPGVRGWTAVLVGDVLAFHTSS